jgi:hypothetical protein
VLEKVARVMIMKVRSMFAGFGGLGGGGSVDGEVGGVQGSVLGIGGMKIAEVGGVGRECYALCVEGLKALYVG